MFTIHNKPQGHVEPDWCYDQKTLSGAYANLDERWNQRAARLNTMLKDAGVPVQVANLSSIWTVAYTAPSRYNWMLQFYLREQGLALSWVGTGRTSRISIRGWRLSMG